jgi:hypothetical protein
MALVAVLISECQSRKNNTGNYMFNGLFVDDAEKDKDIGLKLESEELRMEYLKPDRPLVELSENIISKNPDCLALDYRLDEEREKTDSPNRYKAGPLAQQLRDLALEDVGKDFPIVLVSHEQKIRHDFTPDLTAHDLFDRFYSKEQLVTKPDECREEILAMVYGYKSLTGNWGSANKLAILLQAKDEELSEIDQQPFRDINSLKAPHQIIRGFLRYFIDRSGILLDNNNLLAKLGVVNNTENLNELLKILRDHDILYSGPLARGWNRWWNNRLDSFVQKICEINFGNLGADQRTACLNERLGLQLQPAISRWTGRSDVMFAFTCSSCANPTEREHSVAAYDPIPHRGLTMQKRICWKCVQTGEYQDVYPPLSIHEDDQFISSKIESGELA